MKALSTILCLFILINCQAQHHLTDDTQARIDDIFSHVDSTTPGYALGVLQDSTWLIKKAYGSANLEYKIPITSRSVFNVASVSKQFTAACIALLMLEGKIQLDDPVDKYIEDFPPQWSMVQIQHLIYMTSGINDYYYNARKNGTDWSSLHFFNIDTAIAASYASQNLMYAPGTQWSYSNINYMLLTKIVESISGIPFSQFAKERIFDPLGMNDTYVNDDIFQVIPNRVHAYNHRNEENTGWLKEHGYLRSDSEGFLQIHRNSPHYGGSGVFTTIEDMGNWLRNFQSRQFGGDAFYDLMHKRMKFQHDKDNDAFGLAFGDFNGQEIVFYEGGDWGISSYMMRFPKHKLSVVCFSNLGTGKAQKHAIAVLEVLIEEGYITWD